jgi:hypothetical protein
MLLKRARGSHSVQQFPAHGSRHVEVDTQAIVTGDNVGYRPVLEVEQNAVPNPYSREGIAHMGYMDHTPIYKDADMERLYSHNEADVGDSETQGPDNPHSRTSATQGE